MNNMKSINIKGKEYVTVATRVAEFNRLYPEGSITTELISTLEAERVVIKATVIPAIGRQFSAYSQAVIGDGLVNKTSALENAETSAVGRALGFMGIGVIETGIATSNEMIKAGVARHETPSGAPDFI